MEIKSIVNDIAAQMGLFNLDVSLVDGVRLGCTDVFLLNISTQGYVANSLVYRCDIKVLEEGVINERLEIRIRNALSRLEMMIQ